MDWRARARMCLNKCKSGFDQLCCHKPHTPRPPFIKSGLVCVYICVCVCACACVCVWVCVRVRFQALIAMDTNRNSQLTTHSRFFRAWSCVISVLNCLFLADCGLPLQNHFESQACDVIIIATLDFLCMHVCGEWLCVPRCTGSRRSSVSAFLPFIFTLDITRGTPF